MPDSLWPHGLQYSRLPCPSPTPRAYSDSYPVGNAVQPSHPLSSPFPPALSLSQHQGLFQWVNSSHQVAKVLEFQLQHQSFQWIISVDFLKDWLVWSCSPKGLPGVSAGKESPCNAGDLGSIPRLGRSPGEGNGYPLQYSCLENSMDRGAWQVQSVG